jgi:hypothetical protein
MSEIPATKEKKHPFKRLAFKAGLLAAAAGVIGRLLGAFL